MNVTLHDNSTLTCEDKVFKSGADGAIYKSVDGSKLVKIYHAPEPWRSSTLESILNQFNAVRGEPYWEQFLCWPTHIVKAPSLGIVVPFAHNMRKVADVIVPKFLNRHPEYIGTFYSRLAICIRLARAVRRLHFKGLCHSDLSENNVLLNINDGRTLVIDMDGLVVPDKARPVVNGTKTFMAPELVTKKIDTPEATTDRHALAVLIYQILLIRHPLYGQQSHDPDPDQDDFLRYGERALFTEHPTNSDNRPKNLPWPRQLLGPRVNNLFDRAFVTGLQNPDARPLASTWERDLIPLLDTVVWCGNPNCLFKSFPLLHHHGKEKIKCPWCGTPFGGFILPTLQWQTPVAGQPGLYRSDGTCIVANQEMCLYEYHIRPNTVPGPALNSEPMARFWCDNSLGTSRWCLLNVSTPLMEVADQGGSWKRIYPGEGAQLLHGRKFRFGAVGQTRDAVVVLQDLT